MARKPLDESIIRDFCKRYAANHTGEEMEELIFSLIVDGITNIDRVRNYVMIEEYPEYLAANQGHCSSATWQVAIKYDLSFRQTQNILYRTRADIGKGKDISPGE